MSKLVYGIFSLVLLSVVAFYIFSKDNVPSSVGESREGETSPSQPQFAKDERPPIQATENDSPVVASIPSASDNSLLVTTDLNTENPAEPEPQTLDKFGSRKSQEMFQSRLQDREGFFDWVAVKFEEGLDDREAIARNEQLIAEHITASLEGLDIEITLSCSKSLCFVDMKPSSAEEIRQFAMAFSKDWPRSDDFMRVFSGTRLPDGTNRTVLFREDI